MKFKKTISILFALLVFVLTANIANAGLGISPSQMTVEHLLRNSQYKKVFTLSNSNPSSDASFRVEVDDSLKDWITTDKGMEFVWPAGEQRFPVTIIVNPPADVANGSYEGFIRLISTPKSGDEFTGSGTSVALAATIKANLTISGEQVLEYDISAVKINKFEEESPLGVAVTVNNTGNVRARPTKIHLDVYDKLKQTILESHDITEMGYVEPFSAGDIVAETDTDLDIDQYWATISVYRDDALLLEDDVFFEVVEIGSLDKQGVLKELKHQESTKLGEVVKIVGLFENTGKSNLSAKLILEIYKDDKLMEVLESDELKNIELGEIVELPVYFEPSEVGKYTAKGHVVFSGKTTPIKESVFDVRGGGLFDFITNPVAGLTSTNIFVVLIIVLIIIGVIVFLIKNKKKIRKN